MKDLKCPFCKGDLKITHQERYQDLIEHVSQPNAQPSLKDGYECLNVACLAFGTFNWIEDGDYFSTRPEGFTYREWLSLKKAVSGSENYHAIGSWNYYYQMGKDVINKVCKLTIGHSHTKQNWNFYLIISIEKRLDFLNKSTKDIFPIKKSRLGAPGSAMQAPLLILE